MKLKTFKNCTKELRKKNHKSKEQGLNRKATYEKLKLNDEIEKKNQNSTKGLKTKIIN
jgi:hypothetical protein